MTGIASALRSPGATPHLHHHPPPPCACDSQARVCVLKWIRACVGVRVFQDRPETTLTLTTLPARPSSRLNHPALIHYQGSIALTHKRPDLIWLRACFPCMLWDSVVDEVWLPPTGVILHPAIQSGSFPQQHLQINSHLTHLGLVGPPPPRDSQKIYKTNRWNIRILPMSAH